MTHYSVLYPNPMQFFAWKYHKHAEKYFYFQINDFFFFYKEKRILTAQLSVKTGFFF